MNSEMAKLCGKNAIVTGGMGGIGYAICVELLNCGLSKLAIVDLQFDLNLFDELKTKFIDKEVIYKKLDVSDQIQIDNTFKEIKKTFKQIHILVNSAGVFNDRNVQKTLDVNVVGVINSSLVAAELMNPQNGGEGGTIINLASLAGLKPVPIISIYTASKYAVIGFTRCFGTELYYQNFGVKCMAVCPGMTNTTMVQHLNDNFLYPFLHKRLESIESSITVQNPETVGKCVVDALELNRNGSIWSSNNNRNREIELQEFSMDMVN